MRTALLAGSRARTGAAGVDAWSDWDVVLFTRDPAELEAREDWLETFGDVLVWIPETTRHLDRTLATRLVAYAEGHRIDFTISTTDVLRVLSLLPELPPWLDSGYRVLVDKDLLGATMVPPSGRGYAGSVPELETVTTEVRAFLFEALVAGKQLARDDMLAAAHATEAVMRHGLYVGMLEHLARARSGWTAAVGPVGRGVARILEPEWIAVALTRGPGGGEPSWTALTRLLDAYSEAAREVLEALGSEYPDALHERVRDRLKTLRRR